MPAPPRDILDSGAAFLARQQARFAARDVTYSRAASGSYTVLPATKGASRFDTTDDQGAVSSFTSIDFVIERSKLVLDDIPVDPRPGDRITDADGSVYEVMAIPGEPASRDTDQYRHQHRIHTKLVETPPA